VFLALPVFLVLLGFSDYVTEFFGRFHYMAPFTVLLLCGLGLPLPEEVALIGSGILLYQGEVKFVPIMVVCSLAILLGDSIPYWLGRHYGLAALKTRWVAKVLHPERFAALERRFAAHGNYAVFTCRFLPGLRIPGYFVAGTLRMSYPRFIFIDFLGVLISVPASIYLGKIFGDSMESLRKKVHDLHLWLALGVVALILIFLVRAIWRKREKGEPEDI
jgi:membrane protein DedA with SNARE-associated domain